MRRAAMIGLASTFALRERCGSDGVVVLVEAHHCYGELGHGEPNYT